MDEIILFLLTGHFRKKHWKILRDFKFRKLLTSEKLWQHIVFCNLNLLERYGIVLVSIDHISFCLLLRVLISFFRVFKPGNISNSAWKACHNFVDWDIRLLDINVDKIKFFENYNSIENVRTDSKHFSSKGDDSFLRRYPYQDSVFFVNVTLEKYSAVKRAFWTQGPLFFNRFSLFICAERL